jgi:hypothetical protein
LARLDGVKIPENLILQVIEPFNLAGPLAPQYCWFECHQRLWWILSVQQANWEGQWFYSGMFAS